MLAHDRRRDVSPYKTPRDASRQAQRRGGFCKSLVVMAFPESEGIRNPGEWIPALVEGAARHPGGLDRTVFMLQAFDWQRNRWISERRLADRIRILRESGAGHLAYFPDNAELDRPRFNRLLERLAAAEAETSRQGSR